MKKESILTTQISYWFSESCLAAIFQVDMVFQKNLNRLIYCNHQFSIDVIVHLDPNFLAMEFDTTFWSFTILLTTKNISNSFNTLFDKSQNVFFFVQPFWCLCLTSLTCHWLDRVKAEKNNVILSTFVPQQRRLIASQGNKTLA